MSDGLRIMIYDETDKKSVSRMLKDWSPGKEGLLDQLVDVVDLDLGLSHSWILGGWLFRHLRRFDYTKGFSSWGEALKWLNEIEPGREISEIQFWGHGSPGKIWIHREILDWTAFHKSREHSTALKSLAKRMNGDSLFWARTCSTFSGERGYRFAQQWSKNLGCRIAAHTHIIHLYHSGLHCVRPGEVPKWDLAEGIEEGTPSRPRKIASSGPSKPNTIFFLEADIPERF